MEVAESLREERFKGRGSLGAKGIFPSRRLGLVIIYNGHKVEIVVCESM